MKQGFKYSLTEKYLPNCDLRTFLNWELVAGYSPEQVEGKVSQRFKEVCKANFAVRLKAGRLFRYLSLLSRASA